MIAVTGASGLLGSFIVRRLIAANEDVICLRRKSSDISLLDDINHLLRWKDVDLLDLSSIEEGLGDCTKVIHSAALVSFNPRRKREIMEHNVIGTRNLVNACLHLGVARLVHISSVAALGRHKNQKIVDETNKWSDSSLRSNYAYAKYLAELEVFRGEEEGLSTVIVNPSAILAPANFNRSSAQIFKHVWKESPFYISGTLNYVDVRDVAEIAWRLLNDNIRHERFILNAGHIAYKEIFSRIATCFSKRAPYFQVNKHVLHVAAFFDQWRSNLLGVEPMLTRETVRLAGAEFLYDSTKIRNYCQYEFQSIGETIQWCCAYYMQKHGVEKSAQTS